VQTKYGAGFLGHCGSGTKEIERVAGTFTVMLPSFPAGVGGRKKEGKWAPKNFPIREEEEEEVAGHERSAWGTGEEKELTKGTGKGLFPGS